MQTMNLKQLRATVDAGAVLSVTLKAQGAGFQLTVETRRGEVVMVRERDKTPRRFVDPRKAMVLLRELGIREARVDAREWRPEEHAYERQPRPDRAQALKQAHAAAEHDKWFREQVKAGLAEADDPDTVWVAHKVVKQDMARQRKALQARIEAKLK